MGFCEPLEVKKHKHRHENRPFNENDRNGHEGVPISTTFLHFHIPQEVRYNHPMTRLTQGTDFGALRHAAQPSSW